MRAYRLAAGAGALKFWGLGGLAGAVDNDLTLAAADLAASAPEAWDKFGMALANHYQRTLVELAGSDNQSLYKNQGRALAMQWLLDHLAKAKADAIKIRESKRS